MTMVSTSSQVLTVKRRCSIALRAALLVKIILLVNLVCFAQADKAPASPSGDKPLTADERAELLKLIRSLQERVDKLEAAQTTAPQAAPAQTAGAVAPGTETKHDPSTSDDPHVWMEPVVKEKPVSEAPSTASYGRYNPNLGYKLANTEYGDMSVSIYTYARYLNQLGLASNYTDSFGNVKSVQERQDFQLQKVQIKFLGWVLDPKLRYFLYT
ncbi:MAG TPA: hypothetical protein VF290_23175, partial [Pyrinomonadaceae bacterium]